MAGRLEYFPFLSIRRQLQPTFSGQHIQISRRLSSFEIDSLLLRAKVTYSLALFTFTDIPFTDQNFSGHVRRPWGFVLSHVMNSSNNTRSNQTINHTLKQLWCSWAWTSLEWYWKVHTATTKSVLSTSGKGLMLCCEMGDFHWMNRKRKNRYTLKEDVEFPVSNI